MNLFRHGWAWGEAIFTVVVAAVILEHVPKQVRSILGRWTLMTRLTQKSMCSAL